MKRLLLFITAAILSLSVLTGCDVSDTSLPDINDYTVRTQDTSDMPDKDDISDEALSLAEKLVAEDGVYTTPAMVAAYIYTFNKLPSNYITKKEAQQLGWDSSKNYVSDAAPGMSIGGDSFGNREGLLPKGKYRECDINYEGGKRNGERIVYSADGDVYYTADHYNSFTQLY